ncbi:Tn3 family transposase [Pseudomonas sp. TH35]|nr:Tn3 family transposase [Bacillus sp. TH86]MBK5313107.1 Tn3 family transposase [Pseudomonas sp. TH71]MBK5318605.1 Tn3 family transposase [Erwinia sp. TH79]MBK5324107.1 Tn3 family transposase [Bacillus sp. TH59]MBK5339057.1 Tn3 family transposase [Bacillus sp. TH57]MBK5372311.1 Tn3 family transposase [Pseudomonas sp. TH40]MBK5383480.1 Tn3 family transposase [Pseudomonas sp. TH35]MBK5388939.1 Tn3 family transposase [Pseudomonas sp. TH38]MBK5406234.1 Tn3 family transposase [Pseudomonas sp. T
MLPKPLNLVTAAIVLWNTVYLERATQGLADAGRPVNTERFRQSGASTS